MKHFILEYSEISSIGSGGYACTIVVFLRGVLCVRLDGWERRRSYQDGILDLEK
jgi:hypothetical protein